MLSLSSWQTLDGHMVVRSHARVSSLTLKSIQYTDAGEYICTASNTIGQDSQSMYLEVQCKQQLGKEWMEGGAAKGQDAGDISFSFSRKIYLVHSPRLLTLMYFRAMAQGTHPQTPSPSFPPDRHAVSFLKQRSPT